MQSQFDLPIGGFLHTDSPHFYADANPGETAKEFVHRVVTNLERMIESENPDTVAAFIAEPIQASGGVIIPPAEYFEKIEALLKKHDILFLVDEVICGFGRTGNMFGSDTYGLSPDMMTVAKGMSSGYQPISALAVSGSIYDVLRDASEDNGVFGHGFTYSGHPVAAAVALEVLNIFSEMDIVGHVRAVQDHFQDGLRRFRQHSLVGDIRGEGLIAGIQLVAEREHRLPFDPPGRAGRLFVDHALKYGLITRALGDTVALCPPLIIEKEEIDLLITRIGKALDETERSLRPL